MTDEVTARALQWLARDLQEQLQQLVAALLYGQDEDPLARALPAVGRQSVDHEATAVGREGQRTLVADAAEVDEFAQLLVTPGGPPEVARDRVEDPCVRLVGGRFGVSERGPSPGSRSSGRLSTRTSGPCPGPGEIWRIGHPGRSGGPRLTGPRPSTQRPGRCRRPRSRRRCPRILGSGRHEITYVRSLDFVSSERGGRGNIGREFG